MKNNQIATIASKAADVIIPKPTKNEVIAALVLAAKNEWEAKEKKRDGVVSEIWTRIAAWAKTHPDNWIVSDLAQDDFKRWAKEPLKVTVKLKPDAQLKAMLKELDDVESIGYFNERDVTEKIKSVMAADPRRVKALSESPEITKMLGTIQSIFNK